MNIYEVNLIDVIYTNEMGSCLDIDLIVEILASGFFQLI